MSLAALRGEFSKLYRQRITYASFAVILVLVGLITWGSHHERERFDVGDALGPQFIVAGKSVTALFVARAAMEVALTVLVPVLIAVVVGAMVAGERQLGTLRTLLSRPVRRGTVLVAKLIVGWSFAVALTLFLGLTALGLGQVVFGWGDLVIPRRGLIVFDSHTGLVRVIQAYGLACASMCAVASLGLMLSTVFDNPLTASGLTVAFLLVSGMVGLMPYFEAIKPHLLTTHLDIYEQVFAASIDSRALWTSAAYLGGYALVAVAIAMVVFDRRDVTC